MLKSILVALPFWLVVIIAWIGFGRRVARSGLELCRNQILLWLILFDVTLVALLVLLQAILNLIWSLQSSTLAVGDVVGVGFIGLWGCRLLWNYWKLPHKIVDHYALVPCSSELMKSQLQTLAEQFEISPPLFRISARTTSPFVFGRSLRHTILVLPAEWTDINQPDREFMVCHEFAHIRNRDIGLTMLAQAFLIDLPIYWLALLPLLGLGVFEQTPTKSSLPFLVGFCLFFLWFLLRRILREREMLADNTVALLVDQGRLASTLATQTMPILTSVPIEVTPILQQRMIQRIRAFLWDKALFASQQRYWRYVADGFDYCFTSHPLAAYRMDAWNRQSLSQNVLFPSRQDSFWSGAALGLLATTLTLACVWLGSWMWGIQEDTKILHVAYNLLGFAGPIGISLAALFLVLPIWASVKMARPDKRQFALLLNRQVFSLLGMFPVVIVVGAVCRPHPLIFLAMVLVVLWVGVILFCGTALFSLLWVFWLVVRYSRRELYDDLALALYITAWPIVCISLTITLGLMALIKSQVVWGVTIMVGAILGLGHCMLQAGASSFSATDHFGIILHRNSVYRFEGKTLYRKVPWFVFLYFLIWYLPPVGGVVGTGYFLASSHIIAEDQLLGLAFLLLFTPAILMALVGRWRRKRPVAKCQVISQACSILKHIGHDLQSEDMTKLRHLIDQCAITHVHLPQNKIPIVTTGQAYDWFELAHPDYTIPWRKELIHWIADCENEEGYGIWPGSVSRLCSTYQCLVMLQHLHEWEGVNTEKHIRWILAFQQADGSFRDRTNKRLPGEETYYAIASLFILDDHWTETRATVKHLTMAWIHSQMSTIGHQRNSWAMVAFCLAMLNLFDELTESLSQQYYDWLVRELNRTLLSHLPMNLEKAFYMARVYNILSNRHVTENLRERLAVLGRRLRVVLDCELDDLISI